MKMLRELYWVQLCNLKGCWNCIKSNINIFCPYKYSIDMFLCFTVVVVKWRMLLTSKHKILFQYPFAPFVSNQRCPFVNFCLNCKKKHQNIYEYKIVYNILQFIGKVHITFGTTCCQSGKLSYHISLAFCVWHILDTVFNLGLCFFVIWGKYL